MAAIGVAFLSLRPMVLAEQRWRTLLNRGLLRIGTDPSVRPFSFYGPDGWEGLDADIAREAARRLGLQVEAVPVGYDGLYDALTAGYADAAMSALVVDVARTADFRYSRPYFDAGLRAVAPASLGLRKLDDLRGRCVAVALGSEGDRFARWLERRVPRLVRRVVEDEEGALAEMRAGRCEAAIVGGVQAVREGCAPTADQADAPPLRCLRLQPVAYVMAAPQADARLVAELDRVLTEMVADGTLARIIRRWLPR